ncbi:MAG TPA: rhomboid family intramembrane serine protease [Alcanivoracaceae bacterium]|nr:rhomboid family intramembrane serine protease [Alcanivoracaceae bacterium]
MFEIARFSQPEGAQALADALEREGHAVQVRPLTSGEGYGVYSATAQGAEDAQLYLDAWLESASKQQRKNAWEQGKPVNKTSQFYVQSSLLRGWWQRFGWVTKTVFIATVLVFFAPLTFKEYLFFPETLNEVAQQPWRMITPMLLHFGALHIIFNLMFWMELGGVIERFQSSQQLLLVTVVTAAASALAQFFSTGPNFGGLSGVVYGLLGYLWLYGKTNPQAGYGLRREIVIMMLGWLVFCYVVLPDIVANEAHLFGFVSGALLGAVVGYYRRFRYFSSS